MPRVVLESPEVAVDLDQLVFGPAAAGALPELPPAVTSLLAQASQRGTPLPFDAASLVAAAAADTTPLPGLEAVTGLLRLDVSRGVVPTVPVPPSPAGSAPRKAPRKQAPSGANILAKRNSLVDHLQRNAVRLVRAALTLGDLRTALHKATADGATPGTLRLLAAAIARMESLCNRLEHAIVVDGEALTRLDSAPEGEG
ncbi:MAG: hypothetical protein VKS61_18620 [Candidatus Sericytochromatia bacterium]|nr:hypothetical protein [Candidatus Sericytochromatia bacterium]